MSYHIQVCCESFASFLPEGRPVPLCPDERTFSECLGMSQTYQQRSFQPVCAAGFDALKMYRLVLKKYLPASLRRSNSLCHSLRSSAETSFLRATKSRIPCASPLL